VGALFQDLEHPSFQAVNVKAWVIHVEMVEVVVGVLAAVGAVVLVALLP
jgi:hypothetical protein